MEQNIRSPSGAGLRSAYAPNQVRVVLFANPLAHRIGSDLAAQCRDLLVLRRVVLVALNVAEGKDAAECF